MSKERARARAEREAQRAAERAQAERKRARQARLAALKPSLPEIPRRRRRYGALPLRVVLGLAFGWLVTQWVFWQVVSDMRTRIGLAVVSVLALPIVVVLLPTRGRR